MDQELARYLNDHLAGASGALILIEELAESHDAPEAKAFFTNLRTQVDADRNLLQNLLEKIDQHPSTLLKVAGGIAARVGGLKLMWEGVKPGQLGLFEALEMLAIGVQGKLLLWIALQETAGWFPEWQGVDFAELQLQAIKQRDGVEAWRIQAAIDILADAERRAAITPSSDRTEQ